MDLIEDVRARMRLAVDRSAPLYQQVAQAIRISLAENGGGQGVTLPGERRLAGALDVSRVTIRKAIDCLVADRSLVRRHGARTVGRRAGRKVVVAADQLLRRHSCARLCPRRGLDIPRNRNCQSSRIDGVGAGDRPGNLSDGAAAHRGRRAGGDRTVGGALRFPDVRPTWSRRRSMRCCKRPVSRQSAQSSVSMLRR